MPVRFTRTGTITGWQRLDNTSAKEVDRELRLAILVQLEHLVVVELRADLHLSLDVVRARHVILIGVRRRENNSCPKYCRLFCGFRPQGLGHRPRDLGNRITLDRKWARRTLVARNGRAGINSLLSCRLRCCNQLGVVGGFQRDSATVPAKPVIENGGLNDKMCVRCRRVAGLDVAFLDAD